MKLLGVPKLENGTGESQAQAVYELIEKDWNLSDQVKSMAFDTTASNTGKTNGACVLLEKKLNKNLLGLACRHHIHELIIAKVFAILLEKASSGPDIKLFQRFATAWKSLNKDVFQCGIADEAIASELNPIKDDLVAFLNSQLS
jgi:hypothetical protein